MAKKKKVEPPFLSVRFEGWTPVYNPKYGDNRRCVCGHTYERHFDSYENMANVGCKYQGSCGCEGFIEKI